MITSGLLARDIEDVTTRGISTLNNFYCNVILHTEKDDIQIPFDNIKFIDCKRDYVSDLGERYLLLFVMAMGDFVYDVYLNRNNLEMTLEFKVVDGEGKLLEFKEKYKCLLNNVHQGMDAPGIIGTPREVLNQGEIIPVNVECVSRTLESLVNLPANCNLADCTVEDALYYGIHQAISKNKPQIDGENVKLVFDITKPHNTLSYTKISTLNTGFTNLTMLRLPTYLQETYGVYNGGMSTFLQSTKVGKETKDVISIYPTYDYTSYNDPKVKKKACFYIPMTATSDLSEGTFFKDGDVLKAIVTTDSFNVDKGDDDIRSKGTEVVFTHPKSLLNQSGTKSDGEKKLQYDRDKIANVTTIHKTSDGTSNVKYLGVTGNAYAVRSDIMIASAVGFEMTWLNGAWYEITPGMPICILKETQQEGIVTYYGKIVGLYMSYDRIKGSSVVTVKAICRREVKEGE